MAGETKEIHDLNLKALLKAASEANLTFNESKSTFSVPVIDVLGYRISHEQIKPDPERLRPLVALPIPKTTAELKRCVGMFAYYARWIKDYSSKIKLLIPENTSLPLSSKAVEVFESLRKDLLNACLGNIDDKEPFTVECDASNFAIAAVLNQNGRPVAFMSRTFSPGECNYSTVEKEATSIIEAIRKWAHYLHGCTFTLVTDQRSLAFMFDPTRRGKVKNAKIQSWRAELGTFSYTIQHKPGSENVPPDTMSRVCGALLPESSLKEIHKVLGHSGAARLSHFVRSKNLTYSMDDIRQVCSQCKDCAELKPRFFIKDKQVLIKASQPWERVSMDFKRPLRSTKNRYLLVLIDEFSRFPFAFPCRDLSTKTVISCISILFSLFGFPAYIHSDRGSSFMSREINTYLHERGIATSHSTPHHPTGNSQCERLNQTLWKTIQLMLRTQKLDEKLWETVLPEALHSIRSLLCTATNATPHERFVPFTSRSMFGRSLPSWLINPGVILIRKHNRNKDEPFCEEVELLHANPSYAYVRFPDGRETTVSTNDLAPQGTSPNKETESTTLTPTTIEHSEHEQSERDPVINERFDATETVPSSETIVKEPVALRRSTRLRKAVDRYGAVPYQ